jgi:hypothetical protein
MNIYHVDGVRHQAVVFGSTPEDAVAQALASGEVGDWKSPEARRVPLPEGYALRQVYPDLMVVALSARPEERQAALEAGADAFVSKTDPPECLLEAIQAATLVRHG